MFLGILIGTLSLVALVKVLRRGRYRHGLYWVFRRLKTTPEQERTIRQELESLRQTADGTRGEWRASKSDLVTVLAAERYDAEAVEATFRRHDGLLAELRKAGSQAFERVHATLSPEQRKELASMLSWAGPGFHRSHHRGCHC